MFRTAHDAALGELIGGGDPDLTLAVQHLELGAPATFAVEFHRGPV